MDIDTTWGSFVVRALESSPSTGMVVIFVCAIVVVAFAYLVMNLSKNTELTKAIIQPHAEMQKTIQAIRVDQVTSNLERKAMQADIKDLQDDFHKFRCANAPTCPKRQDSV